MTARYDPSLSLMEKLVSFPTVSRDTNIPADRLGGEYPPKAKRQSRPHRYNSTPISPSTPLFCAAGPWGRKARFVLSGPIQIVVPVDGQPWTVIRFTVVERDGRYMAVAAANYRRVRRAGDLALERHNSCWA